MLLVEDSNTAGKTNVLDADTLRLNLTGTQRQDPIVSAHRQRKL
jgi:hypothetical protein